MSDLSVNVSFGMYYGYGESIEAAWRNLAQNVLNDFQTFKHTTEDRVDKLNRQIAGMAPLVEGNSLLNDRVNALEAMFSNALTSDQVHQLEQNTAMLKQLVEAGIASAALTRAGAGER